MAKIGNVVFFLRIPLAISTHSRDIEHRDTVLTPPADDFILFIRTNRRRRAGEKTRLGAGCS